MECFTYLRHIQDLLSDRMTPYERRFGQLVEGPIIPFGSLVDYYPIIPKDQSRIHHFWKESLTRTVPWKRFVRREFGRVTYWSQTLRSWRRWTHRKSTQERLIARKYFPRKVHLPSRRWNKSTDGIVKTFGGDRRLRPCTLIRDILLNEERKKFFWENQTDISSPNLLQDDSTRDDAEA